MNVVDRLLVLGIPVVFAITHYLGLHSNNYLKRHKTAVKSFAGGFSAAYIFVYLIPELLFANTAFNADSGVLVLMGFAGFHVLHRVIYDTAGKQTKIRLSELHLVTAALYSFLVSFSVVQLALADLFRGWMFAIIFCIHVGVIELSQPYPRSHWLHLLRLPILIGATILGGCLSLVGQLTPGLTLVLFALTAGTVIYSTIREELPDDEKSNVWWFVVGVVSLVVSFRWLV